MITRRRLAALVVLVVYWLTLFIATHIPPPRVQSVTVSDKTMHFVAYAGLAFLLAWAVLATRPTWGRLIMVLLITISYGAVDEALQLMVPGRYGDLGDWVADVAGAVCGLVAYGVSLPVVQRVLNAADRQSTTLSVGTGEDALGS